MIDGKRRALNNVKSPETWRDRIEATGHGLESQEDLSEAESADEYLLMGLRLAEGIDLKRLRSIGGKSPEVKTIDALSAQGLVWRQGERLAATPAGRLVLERLILELATKATSILRVDEGVGRGLQHLRSAFAHFEDGKAAF
jgi:oxygen-independent coproporphyrinogen-3 oxidase